MEFEFDLNYKVTLVSGDKAFSLGCAFPRDFYLHFVEISLKQKKMTRAIHEISDGVCDSDLGFYQKRKCIVEYLTPAPHLHNIHIHDNYLHSSLQNNKMKTKCAKCNRLLKSQSQVAMRNFAFQNEN